MKAAHYKCALINIYTSDYINMKIFTADITQLIIRYTLSGRPLTVLLLQIKLFLRSILSMKKKNLRAFTSLTDCSSL